MADTRPAGAPRRHLPGRPPDRQAFFERADNAGKIDQAAAIARLWQQGAIRQGVLVHPGQFAPPRQAPLAPHTGEESPHACSVDVLTDATFQRALATPATAPGASTEPVWAALSPWFDPAYYAVFVQRGRLSLSACPEDRADAAAAVAYARGGLGRGERASIYYDPVFYRLHRPGLAEASFAALMDDYAKNGLDQGIAASADFDPVAFGRSRAYDIQRWISGLRDGELAGELGRRPHLAAVSFHAAELRHGLDMPSTKTGEVVFPRMTAPGVWRS